MTNYEHGMPKVTEGKGKLHRSTPLITKISDFNKLFMYQDIYCKLLFIPAVID